MFKNRSFSWLLRTKTNKFSAKAIKESVQNHVQKSLIFMTFAHGFEPKLLKNLFKTATWKSIWRSTRALCLRAQAARSDTLLRIHREAAGF